MKNIIERISFISEKENVKLTTMEKEIGASKGVLSRALNKNTDIQSKWITKIVENYPQYNSEWLLTGKGEILKSNEPLYPSHLVGKNESEDEKLLNIRPSPYYTEPKGVPYYDVDFTAGFLEVLNDQHTQPDSYVSHPFFKNCDYVVRASGQSMAKVIKHGDAIGLIKIEDWMDFIPLGEIYAIVTTNNFRMVKIITKGETKDSFTLISKPTDAKKEEFPPQQIQKNKILSIFKVQACAHLF